MAIKKGLYESVINRALGSGLAEARSKLDVSTEKIDGVQGRRIFAAYLSQVLELGLSYFRSSSQEVERQIELVNRIISQLANDVKDDEFYDYLVLESELLRSITEQGQPGYQAPQTSIAVSSLFTGARSEPRLYAELRREIHSADQIDLLISFIRFNGLRLILPDLKEHTRQGKLLRVITTSYMGVTEYKAVEALAKLPNSQVRVSYDTKRTRLHAKAYYFQRESGFSTAYIGSSNMSKTALTDGLEWNLKISEHTSREVMEKYRATFETYWNSPDFEPFNPSEDLERKRLQRALTYKADEPGIPAYFDIRPYNYQQQILDQLRAEREVHNSRRNLVVAATGTGKTVIAAFDFKRYYAENPNCRLLFVAHRQEILQQSADTFRGVLKDNNFGDLWVGDQIPSEHNHLFASIQTLAAGEKFRQFPPDYFDFIVIDETHHASAATYDRLLGYFNPDLLLGLTATPERLDGEDITKYFNYRIASEIRLGKAIEDGLLCPFHYFGISDDVDLSQLKWSAGGYDINELNSLYLDNKRRVATIVKALKTYCSDLGKIKGLGFCVSQEHAAFMARSFNRGMFKAINLDASSPPHVRRAAKSKLERGEIQFIFVVDLYNEGVDIPDVNTILFLRPTQSPTIFIQQLGRGLRITDDKEVLTVLDFVGRSNREYSFERKFRALIGPTRHSVREELEHGFPSLPRGCFIQLERKAEEHILENLGQTELGRRRLIAMIKAFVSEGHELTLGGFLNYYDLEPISIYRRAAFYELCHAAGVFPDYRVEDTKQLNRALGWVMQIDSREWIDFLRDYLNRPEYTLKGLSPEEEKMLLMFHYSVWNRDAEGDLVKYLNRLREQNTSLFQEILELLDYNRAHITFIGEKAEVGYPLPLELYASYSSHQVLAALGVHSDEKMQAFQEGVRYVQDKRTDVFFVTLDKSDKSFTPDTQYEDYAINERLFHWQSQSRISDKTPTGLRYINQRREQTTVLLFVRERKDLVRGKITSAFYFLGKANYVSHSGSKPISIVWEMEKPIPAAILEKSNTLVG
jgi:superfamily II DNA or RNA helicase